MLKRSGFKNKISKPLKRSPLKAKTGFNPNFKWSEFRQKWIRVGNEVKPFYGGFKKQKTLTPQQKLDKIVIDREEE